MKTLEQVLSQFKTGCIDGRDARRLYKFVPEERLADIGIELKDECVGKHLAKEFTRENVIEQLKNDVEFGFEKALGQRGISSSLMADVVKMWNWVLDEGLENFDEYPMYGLPIFKITALKYGFDNPIGDDDGSEGKYDCDH